MPDRDFTVSAMYSNMDQKMRNVTWGSLDLAYPMC